MCVLAAMAAVGGGCTSVEHQPGLAEGEREGFWVASVRLDPAFSKVSEADDEGGEVVVKVVVQLRDQFGDPRKGLGQFRFEVFRYRLAHSDVRGARVEIGGKQLVDLRDVETNQEHWDEITRAYRIELPLPARVPGGGRLVLQVTFVSEEGYRLEDQMVLELGG